MNERETEVRKLLGMNIKKFRSRKTWSQAVLAEHLNISTNFLADVETGKKWVSSTTLGKLADVLDICVHELFLPPVNDAVDGSMGGSAGESDSDKRERFINDLSIGIKHSVEQAIERSIEHISKQYMR